MVIDLSNGIAVSVSFFQTVLVCLQDRLVDIGFMPFHPGEERWTKIEADFAIIVGDLKDAVSIIHDPCGGIRCITFCKDLFIPVMKGFRRVLDFQFIQPRIFTWRLIEMPMNAKVSFHRKCNILNRLFSVK